jgi:photosystem II stability/assembly factor-like uncharacterized protein
MKRLVVLAVCLLACAPAQAADVTTGHSGWNWGNPPPQGNTLLAIEFAGTRGFATGDFGTLVRTDDRGRSWTGVRLNSTTNISHISIADQDHVVVGGGCEEYRSSDGGITFVPLRSSCSTSTGVESFAWPSPLVGYELREDGAIWRTTDGETFAHRGDLPGTEAGGATSEPTVPRDVFFTDDNTGFAITRGAVGGALYRTTDGGATWFQRTTSAQSGLNNVYFPDASTGYAVGSANTVLKTTDGGETWDVKAVPDSIPSSELTRIRCGTPSNCLITTDTGDFVLRTGNGGNSFTSFPPAAQKIFAVSFSSPSQAVAVGENGTTVISTNASTGTPSFVSVADRPLIGGLSRLRAPSASLVLATGTAGRLARSTDGGRTWESLQVPTSEDLRDAWFVDQNVGFALDTAGGLQRTMDGGQSWSEVDTAAAGAPDAVYAFDASVVLLIGPQGVRRATDAVTPNFAPVGGKKVAGATVTDYDRTAGGAVFVYGRKAQFSSTDLGLHWRTVGGPVKNPRYRRVDFLSAKVGFALMESGRLFRTRTGGETWSEIVGTGSSGAFDLSFADARSGWLSLERRNSVDNEGWVLHTSDGGSTWRPQLISRSALLPHGLAAGDPNIAFGLGPAAELFYTSIGGDQQGARSSIALKPARRVVTRPRKVRITGTVTGAAGARDALLLARDVATHKWRIAQTLEVKADDTFTATVRIRRTTQFVAQWPGNATVSGAGSHAVTIRKR